MKNIFLTLFVLLSAFTYSQESLNNPDLIKYQKRQLTKGIILGSTVYAGGAAYLTHLAYREEEPVPFHILNDFRTFLQIDKFHHAFISYAASSVGYDWLRSTGADRKKALIYSGTIGVGLSATKEIIDGFNRHSGFSWADISAGIGGTSLFIGQELLLKEQIFINKFSFLRSGYADQANGSLGNNQFQSYFKDFNGHTYWLSMNANRLVFRNSLPSWINIAAGYSANGMFGAFENASTYNSVAIPVTERYRQYLLSMDIDWSKIPTDSKFVSTLFKAMNFIKIPFPAIEVNSKGEFRGYWFYF